MAGEGGVPPGVYTARFLGVSVRRPEPGAAGPGGRPFGPALVWAFKVTDGPHAWKRVSRFTGLIPTARNACGRMLAGVSGRPAADAEVVDVARFVGSVYRVAVELTDRGDRTRVADVPAPARQER